MLARSGLDWLDLAALRTPGRPGCLDLAALRASGRPAGSIWLLAKRDPVQRNDDFATQGQCFVDVALVASIWLLCALVGTLTASIWQPCGLLGALAGLIWLLTNAPTTRLAKRNDLLINYLP